MPIDPDQTALAAFWRDAARDLGLDPAAPAPHFHFGETADLASVLAEEVLNGTKRATAGLVVDMEAAGETLPAAGDVWIVIDGQGQPRAVTRTLDVRIAPFQEVDEAFAWDEGEGDRSLAWWRRAHIDYFTGSCARLGLGFTETLDVMFERFDVIWPANVAARPILRRPSTESEWAAYHQLRQTELFERYLPDLTYDPDFPENWTRDVFHFALFAAGDLCGCLQLRWLSPTEASYELVAVQERWRSRGIGRKMLQEAEAFARLYGRQTLRVFTEPESEPFYRALGFEDGPDWTATPLSAKAKPLKKNLT